MGKNKLAKVNKTKKKKYKTKKKRPNIKVVDVPLSDNISLGSDASLGGIGYNYQKYYNTFTFLKEIINRNNKLKRLVCIPDENNTNPSFVKVNFFKGFENIDSHLSSVNPVNPLISKEIFINEIRKCMNKRFIPISLQIDVGIQGTHANIILFDTKKKTVELFEPHGAYSDDSTLEIKNAYYKVSKNIHKFVKIYFSDYKYVPPTKYEPSEALQSRIDAFNGLCVTWSILYLHYRILNPDISPKRLTQYIDYNMNTNKLLRYTRYVEDIVKGKI